MQFWTRKPRKTRTLDDHLSRGWWLAAMLLAGAFLWLCIYWLVAALW